MTDTNVNHLQKYHNLIFAFLKFLARNGKFGSRNALTERFPKTNTVNATENLVIRTSNIKSSHIKKTVKRYVIEKKKTCKSFVWWPLS